MSKKLLKVVSEIIQNQSNGIRHVELVQEVLNRGITYEGKEGISAGIHSALRTLITKGEIVRNQNDNLDRKYIKSANAKQEFAHVG